VTDYEFLDMEEMKNELSQGTSMYADFQEVFRL
jgi:hypothetical protein